VALDGLKRLFGGGTDDEEESAHDGLCLAEEGKPMLKLPSDPQSEIARAEKLTKDPEARESYIAFISSIYELVVRNDDSPANICDLTRGLSCSHKKLRDQSGTWLMQVSHYFEAARHEMVRVMEQEGEETRLQLVKAIWKNTPPRSTTIALLQHALADACERVRYFAVDRIRACDVRELIPQLQEQRQLETEPKIQRFIDFNIALMEDGFYVEQKPDSQDHLVSANIGSGGISSKTIPADEYSPQAVQRALEQLRSNWNRIKGGEEE